MAKYGVFLKPTTLDRMVLVKTTEAAPTDGDWASQDGEVDFKTIGGVVKSLWYVEQGSDIHIATQQENGRVAYHLFDPGTDTWTIKNETVAVVGDTNFGTAPTLESVALAVRSDGDVVLGFIGDGTGQNGEKLYAVRSGGSWSAVAVLASIGFDIPSGMVVIGPDSSDRISFVYKSTGGNGLRTRSLNSSDSLGTDTLITQAVDAASIIIGPGVINSANKIYAPYIDSGNKIGVANWTSGVSPTVSVDTGISDNTVYGHGRTTAPFIVACLGLDGTDVHLLYANDADQDLYHDNDVDGGGAADSEILDAVTVNRVSCKKGTSDLLYFYDDGGTTKYGTIALVAPSGPPTGTLALLGVGI